MRRNLVIGNWKMHGSKESLQALLSELRAGLDSCLGSTIAGVCPTAIHIPLVERALSGSSIQLGAQNANARDSGALTGEIAAAMLCDFNVSYCLVGHSERRELFSESDADIADKFAAIQSLDIVPVLCIGESLVQRQQNMTEPTILAQIDAVIDRTGIEAFANAVIAYEPIWAIGTGETATPEQAQQVHRTIRLHLAELDEVVAENIQILYGGSVKSVNAADLFSQADIDGGLVGGASLSAEEFIAICKSADSK
ncbi:MAG: triose-phosphate isomerase [Pseudohongiellaceae bacterium]